MDENSPSSTYFCKERSTSLSNILPLALVKLINESYPFKLSTKLFGFLFLPCLHWCGDFGACNELPFLFLTFFFPLPSWLQEVVEELDGLVLVDDKLREDSS